MFVFFLAYFKTGSCCNLEILWITVNDVPLPLKKLEKEEFGMELLSKDHVKIEEADELISKDNLTDKQLICIIYQKKWVISLFKGSACRPPFMKVIFSHNF